MKEEWKKIPNCSKYEASTLGRLKTFNWRGTGKEAIIKPAKDKKGYLRTVLISDNKVKKTIKVHRIIAQTFIENPKGKPQVNHKNGVKDDNRVCNLEWMTNKENHHHAKINGLLGDGFLKAQKDPVPECFKNNWK